MKREDVADQSWRRRAVAGGIEAVELVELTPPPESQRARMARWFSPSALLRTAVDVVASSVIGKHSDARLIEALAVPTAPPHDYTTSRNEQGDFWFDYVADSGDGWNSTYAIALAIAQPTLDVRLSARDEIHSTRRGQLLVFGGDEVYPTPSQTDYQRRLESAYRTAFHGAIDPPDVFAIPGNHDWYDSLVAFSRLFVAQRKFGPCQTLQKRSYFALKLPHNWWLLAVDVQLGSDIDAAQMRYFERIATEIDEDARVILCVSEPHWIYSRLNGDGVDEGNLVVLEQKVLNHRVMVFVAGDQHYYARHEGPNQVQKIICGGGGAFLHATHRPKKDEKLDGSFDRRACYPPPRESAKLAWRNLAFPLINPEFSIIPAIVYTMTAMIARLDYGGYGVDQAGSLLADAAARTLVDPIWLTWLVLLQGGFILFSDRSSGVFRVVGGMLHGLAHVVGALVIAWLAFSITETPTPTQEVNPMGNAAALALVFALGAIIGSFLFGAYLFVCLTYFGKQVSAAFSGLRIQDWKSFLRFRIDARGNLEIYAIGIDRVCRRWKRSDGEHPSTLVPHPKDKRATPPRLIERVTLIPEPAASRLKMCTVYTDGTGCE
ncbi:MAG: hypothetical protein WD425_01505 [Nitrospirales bacterium]